jgi:outer membrane protein assembly factor BamB
MAANVTGLSGGKLRRTVLLLLLGSLAQTTVRADDWPQWLGPRRDGVWRETGILDKFPPGGPAVRWRTPIGAGYTGPAVANGRVYVMDRQPPKEGAAPAAQGTLPGIERILCLDTADGKIIWKHEYDCPYVAISFPSGPRTTPLVHEGRVYTLGTMGDLLCLDAATGKVHWSRNIGRDYQVKPPVWGWSAHPLLDGDKLICLVGGDGSAVVAFEKTSGKELWRALKTEEIGYAPPMIYEAGGKRQLIVWLTDSVNGLDPETGKPYWSEPYPARIRPAVSIATPRKLGDLLFVSTFYHGPLMLKLAADKPAASVLWRGKSDNPGKPDGLHALITTPVLQDGHIYGVCSTGELRCLKADTGEQLWSTFAATGSGRNALYATLFMVPQGDRFFLFNDLGDLILARLTPKGYEAISRAHLLEPTQPARGRDVVWAHPAFANGCMYARNDKEIICVSLAAAGSPKQG